MFCLGCGVQEYQLVQTTLYLGDEIFYRLENRIASGTCHFIPFFQLVNSGHQSIQQSDKDA